MGFGSIVVAVDGSEATNEALDHAVFLARNQQAGLLGIFVVDSKWPDFIGNDWQSARGTRQGFLDYIRREQEEQAELARSQFSLASQGMEGAVFSVHAGDPASVLVAQTGTAGILLASRRVFQVSGRPSLRSLAATLAKKALCPLMLFP